MKEADLQRIEDVCPAFYLKQQRLARLEWNMVEWPPGKVPQEVCFQFSAPATKKACCCLVEFREQTSSLVIQPIHILTQSLGVEWGLRVDWGLKGGLGLVFAF